MNNVFFKFILFLFWMGGIQEMLAQQTPYQYQYWYDADDLSTYEGNFLDTNDFAHLPLITNTLSTGWHQVHARFKPDTAQKWSSVMIHAFYFVVGGATQVATGEYWWDEDLNAPNSLNINDFEQNETLFKSLNIESLSVGLHRLHIRFQGAAGQSSLFTHWFYKIDANLIRKIERIEYWFDDQISDMAVLPLLALDSIETQVHYNPLSVGLHWLHLRAIGSNGFSSVVTRPFYKTQQEALAVTELLYWLDDNIQNINRLQINNFTNNDTLSSEIPINNLPTGVHRLTIQYETKKGGSSPQSQWFVKPEANQLAYWLYPVQPGLRDTLPNRIFLNGLGNQIEKEITAKVPCDGWYKMGIRVKNGLGGTSIVETRDSIRLFADATFETRATHTTCGQDTAKIIISPPRTGTDWQYAATLLNSNQTPQFRTDTIFANLAQGNYKIQVRDRAGCEMSGFVQVDKKDIPRKDTVITVCDRYIWKDTTRIANDIRIFNDTLTESGSYLRTLKSLRYPTCDSLIRLQLVVNKLVRRNLDTAICEMDSFKLGNRWVRDTGIYRDTLRTWKGCDSITTLRLRKIPLGRDTQYASICQSDTFRFRVQNRERLLTNPGVYYDTIRRVRQCDSIIRLELTVQGRKRRLDSINICFGDMVRHITGRDTSWISKPINKDTIIRFKEIRGCDSLFIVYKFMDKFDLQHQALEARCKYSMTGSVQHTFNRSTLKLQWGKGGISRDTLIQSSTLIINGLDTGFYTLRAIDTIGCFYRDTLGRDTLRLRRNTVDTSFSINLLKFQLDVSDACRGMDNGVAELKGGDTTRYSYSWSPKMSYTTFDTLQHLKVGSYHLAIQHNFMQSRCDTLRFNIIEIDTLPRKDSLFFLCRGDTIKLEIKKYKKEFTKSGIYPILIPSERGCPTLKTVVIEERQTNPKQKVQLQRLSQTALKDSSKVELGEKVRLIAVKVKVNDTTFTHIRVNWMDFKSPWEVDDDTTVTVTPSALVKSVAWVAVRMQDTRKCWMTDTFFFKVSRGESSLPNAFYPKTEGFYVVPLDKGTEAIEKMVIYDAQGIELHRYEGKKFNPAQDGWNGTAQGIEMPQGIYHVILVRKLKNGDGETVRQAFHLFR